MTAIPTDSATPDSLPQSPNDLLAKDVADALVDAGCIAENHKTEMLAKLKSGGVSQDDWNLWIDVATAPETESEAEEAGHE